MDADTIVHYKNGSRDWIYLDNDLCKTKETSKTFTDANQSEYDSNVELFGEITIQFNNEVHLLYDGPVQIKCKNNSPDYKFNCNNLINNPANEHNANISKSNDAITKQNTSIRNIDSHTVIEKFRIPTQPSVTSKPQTKTIKQPAIKNNNSNISGNKTKPIRILNNDDVCSRTSQFFIPRKTIISSECERLNSNTTVTPVECSNASAKLSHSVITTTAVNRTELTRESEISNSIHARFAKLLQSNKNSLHLQNINNIELNQEKKSKLSMQLIKIPYEKHKDRILQVEKSELTITKTIVGPQTKNTSIKASDFTCSRVKEKSPIGRTKPVQNECKISSYNSKIIDKTTNISNKKSEKTGDSKDLKISGPDLCIVKTDSSKKLLVSEHIINNEVINLEEKKPMKSINNKEKVTHCSNIISKELNTAVQKTKAVPDLNARKKTKINNVIEKKTINSIERKFEKVNATDKNVSNASSKPAMPSKGSTKSEVKKEPSKTLTHQTKNDFCEAALIPIECNKEESRLKNSNEKIIIADNFTSKDAMLNSKISQNDSLKKCNDSISVLDPKTKIKIKASTVEKRSEQVNNVNKKITEQVLEMVATACPIIQHNEKVIVTEEIQTIKIVDSDNINLTSNIANILPYDSNNVKENTKISISKPNTEKICTSERLNEKNSLLEDISQMTNTELRKDEIEKADLGRSGKNLSAKPEETSSKIEKSIKKSVDRKATRKPKTSFKRGETNFQDKGEVKETSEESVTVETVVKKNLQINTLEKKVLRSSTIVSNNAKEINDKIISQDLKRDENIDKDKIKVLRSSRVMLNDENAKGLCSEKQSLLRSSNVAVKSVFEEKSDKLKNQKKNSLQNEKPLVKVSSAETNDKTHGICLNTEKLVETNSLPEHMSAPGESASIITVEHTKEVQELESSNILTSIDSKDNVDNESVVSVMDNRSKTEKTKENACETVVINTQSAKEKLACRRKRRRTVAICKPAKDSPVINNETNNSVSKNKLGVQKKVTEYFSVKCSDNEHLNINKISNSASNDATRDQLPVINETDADSDKTAKSATQKECSAYKDFCEAVSFEPSSTILNIQQPPSPLVKSSECLRNISTSVLSANQNSDQNKISPGDGNKCAKAKQSSSDSARVNKEQIKNIPEEPCSLSNETLAVIQKENIPIVTEDRGDVAVSNSKDLTEIAITSTPISKVKVVRKMLRSKIVPNSRPITRSKRPKLANSNRTSLKRKRNLAERKSNAPKARSITEDKTEEIVAVTETIETVKQNSLNNVQSVKRESKLDETENIIRLETIGTEIHTFHCKKCEKIFLRKSLLKKHEIDAHPAKKTDNSPKRVRKIRKRQICETCSEAFPNIKALKLHKCPATNDAAPAEEANITSEDVEPPSKRICVESPDKELKDVEIEECKTEPDSSAGTDEQKDSPNSTSNSKKSKTRTFPCPHCSAITVTTNDLKVHISRVHEKVKDKICPYCSRGFACTGDLTRHIRLHTGEKPFKCSSDGCNMAFIASGDLIKHERTHLGDQCPRNFVCEYCEKTFKQRYEHDRHLRTAHAVALKLFQCQLCKKQFGRKDGLLYHLRLHAGIKPYTCKCGKQFTDSGNLRKHMNTKRHDLPPKKSRKRQQKPSETNEQ